MSEQIVLVFDICSSTSILEDLHRTNTIEKYNNLISNINLFLEKNHITYSYDIYKFLGDGYILLFDNQKNIDKVLEFSIALIYECNEYIKKVIEEDIEAENSILRKGITIGIDCGYISKLKNMNKNEYIGRPINFACRLQSSLKKTEHTNRILLSNKVYQLINEKGYKLLCSKTTRSFRNIVNDDDIKCYEFDPSYYLTKDKNNLRKDNKEKIENEIYKIFLDQFSEEVISNTSYISSVFQLKYNKLKNIKK